MLSLAARRIAFAAPVQRAAFAVAASRPISSSAIIKADHPAVPTIQGEGAPAGQVPTDEQQATGLERCVEFLLGRPAGRARLTFAALRFAWHCCNCMNFDDTMTTEWNCWLSYVAKIPSTWLL
jgi:hypothetical protein